MSLVGCPQNIEVELRGSILKLDNNDLVIRGVWYFSGVGRGDNFEWRATADQCKVDSYGVPKRMVCSGSFDAWFSSVVETNIVLEFSPERWVNANSQTESTTSLTTECHDPSNTNGSNNKSSGSSSSSVSTAKATESKRLLYSVSGQGQNSLGRFSIKGLVKVSLTFNVTDSVLRFHAKKTYEVPRDEELNSTSKAVVSQLNVQTLNGCTCQRRYDNGVSNPTKNKQSKRQRSGKRLCLNIRSECQQRNLNREGQDQMNMFSCDSPVESPSTCHYQCHGNGKKRKRAGEDSITAKEARLRAQHWRRQQLRNLAPRNSRNFGYIRNALPRPVIREAKSLRKGRMKVSWEIATQASFSLAIMTETSLSIRQIRPFRNQNVGEALEKQQVIDFPPFALTREKNIPLDVLSPTRTFSHTLERLSPGLYEVCVLLRPCGNPDLCDQTFDTVRVTVNAPPPAPDKVTALTYAASRNAKHFAVVSWSAHNASVDEISSSSKARFLGDEQTVNSYEICCQVYRKTRNDWVTHEPSKRIVNVGNESNSTLSVCNCIVSDLPRNDRIRITVAAIGPDGPGEFAASSSLDCSSSESSSTCKPNCVICGEDVSFSESADYSNVISEDSSPAGPDCCSHLFHFSCLRKWSKTKNEINFEGEIKSTCPLCCRYFTGIVKHKLKLAQQDDRQVVSISEELRENYIPNPLPQDLQESEWDIPFIRDVYEALFGELPPNDRLHPNPRSPSSDMTTRPPLTTLQQDNDAMLISIINDVYR